eukprot:CAMPEP_0197031870 /NCGR_PEP_ID=MMETSP1384-20130603/10717_1 /TAXON_ID=29189 /ORGANISM="Ammonia sp." /LENGTH=355 /DNA_ID=CAMNT_0042461447 /DNA_START=197 /DNA_END=1264 /DNA_ORIENTATION=-
MMYSFGTYGTNKRDDDHKSLSYHDENSPFHSPPSGLITYSPNTPILNYNPFGSYNTFDTHEEPEYSQTSSNSKQTSNRDDAPLALKFKRTHSHSQHHHHHESNQIGQFEIDPLYASIQANGGGAVDDMHVEHHFNAHHHPEAEYSSADDDAYDSGGQLYTTFGVKYRQFCFSNSGIKFAIFLNVMMVLINSSLIIYEVVLMVNSHSFTTYYDAQLPLIYSIFDILLTLILFIEISLHLTAIYKCHVCNYFKYSHEHKMDILVFFLSLFLCILYIFDAFGVGDMDNISFLALRMIRDVMRFIRCVIFAKFLWDSIVQLHSPQKTGGKRHKLSVSSTPCSSGWDQLKTHKQHQFVCL